MDWKKDKNGYGRFFHTKSSELAHRSSYRLYVNDNITRSNIIRHSCDNPTCVNPSHLLSGTMKQNTADMMERDRGFLKIGNDNPFRKLNEQQATEILKSNLSQKELAEIYNVSAGAIWHIKNRSTWKHITI